MPRENNSGDFDSLFLDNKRSDMEITGDISQVFMRIFCLAFNAVADPRFKKFNKVPREESGS